LLHSGNSHGKITLYARGFAISSYSQLMASERANTCRLKTASEFAMRTVGDAPGFEESTLRLVLAAIHIAIKEDEKPDKGLWNLKNNLPDYWASRDMLKQLLIFLERHAGHREYAALKRSRPDGGAYLCSGGQRPYLNPEVARWIMIRTCAALRRMYKK
jgi:hypothetical protein